MKKTQDWSPPLLRFLSLVLAGLIIAAPLCCTPPGTSTGSPQAAAHPHADNPADQPRHHHSDPPQPIPHGYTYHADADGFDRARAEQPVRLVAGAVHGGDQHSHGACELHAVRLPPTGAHVTPTDHSTSTGDRPGWETSGFAGLAVPATESPPTVYGRNLLSQLCVMRN